jgi:transposase InsO family protein
MTLACSARSEPSATPTTTPPPRAFVDTFKTELITDRSWTSRSQLELAIVKYVAWFNNERIHENLDDRPPREIEELYAVKDQPTIPIKRR